MAPPVAGLFAAKVELHSVHVSLVIGGEVMSPGRTLGLPVSVFGERRQRVRTGERAYPSSERDIAESL